MKFNYPLGATPLDSNEIIGLLPIHITTQTQLNEWEQANILDAENWAFSHHRKNILEIKFCLNLHKQMFNKTWGWAGQFRNSNKNIGVPWEQVSDQLKSLFDDVEYQLDKKVYLLDEIAARFHHRLVFIHPFPNGNGRHARLMTDVFLFNKKALKFNWGNSELISESQIRKHYIDALKEADRGNYAPLLLFVRA